MPSERAVLALGSLESAWISRTACGESTGALGSVEQVPGTGVRGAEVAGVDAVGTARWMIWSGTTCATFGLAARRAASPGETVAATALIVV